MGMDALKKLFARRDFSTRIFNIDARSIRLFHALLGSAIIYNALIRLPYAEAFYSDYGVLPRSLIKFHAQGRVYSIFNFSGETWWSVTLLTVLLLLGIAIALEKEVRKVSFLACLLIAAVHNRNMYLIYGSDNLLAVMCIWCVFLPSSRELRGKELSSLASAGILFQLATIYFCSGWHKSTQAWFWDPTALHYAFSINYFTRDAGRWFGQFTWVVGFFSIGTFVLERFGWLLFFSPFYFAWCRSIGCFLFLSLHLGILILMNVGTFPIHDIVFLAILLPSEFWDRLGWVRSQEEGPAFREPRWISFVVPFMVALVIWRNYETFGSPPPMSRPTRIILRSFGLLQNWKLFAPYPNPTHGWWIFRGKRMNGQTVDVMRFGDVKENSISKDPPADVIATLPSYLWLHYMVAITNATTGQDDVRNRLAQYLCERWAHEKNENLKSVEIIYVEVISTPPGGIPPTTIKPLISRACVY
jgi:hypothetical protein